jgi:hypothetical protein
MIMSMCLLFRGNAQLVFYQDVVQGGITADGFTSTLGSGSGQINLSIYSGSIIKKAFLICGRHGEAESIQVVFNGVSLEFNNQNIVSSSFLSPFYANNNGKGYVHCIDVTDQINPLINTYPITIPVQPILNERYTDFFLVVLYENNLLTETNVVVLINDSDILQDMVYQSNSLNPINNTYDVGMSIHGGYMCDTIIEPTLVYIYGEYLGKIGGNDYNNSALCGGVVGSFYYEQNTLYGLGDDDSNFEVGGSDGLSNIMGISAMNSTNFSAHFHVQADNPSHYSTNPVWSLYLTYTTPCDIFQTDLVTEDTTICSGQPLQLGASGGINYNWLPQTGLSCYDCPNPEFVGDSSMVYTVRIWSTDSCSKVLPVRVRVLPQPEFSSINLTPSACGEENGAIAGTSPSLNLPLSYSLNGGVAQNNGNFNNLATGEYTITLTNAFGCSKDSVVMVGELNNIEAAFTVNPSTGNAPLQVQTQNNSQNATQYQWFWGNQSSTLANPIVTLDTAGVYTLTLIAGNGAVHCNDTASVIIFVKEPFSVFAYTFVTEDADFYQIQVSGVSEFRYQLFALDGKLVYQKSAAIENAGIVELWEIDRIASAVYVFRIWVKAINGEEEEIKGRLVVVR